MFVGDREHSFRIIPPTGAKQTCKHTKTHHIFQKLLRSSHHKQKKQHKPTSNTMGVSSSKPHPIEAQWFPEFKKNLPSLENKTIAITGTTSGT
jgi:hypothetical protein